jgi:phosphoribosylamine---glycine ligase
MNILLIGSGGREHALAWKLQQSKNCGQIFSYPANAGLDDIGHVVSGENLSHEDLLQFAKDKDIGLIVVGPEAPLVEGFADKARESGFPVFGPSQQGAKLEGSKIFMKDLCRTYNIPTARYGSFTEAQKAYDFLNTLEPPYVIKADGLAAGKGVVIAENLKDAKETIDAFLAGKLGASSQSLVIEEFLKGEEISFFALCDGKTVRAFGSAQDHKRVGDGDTGPNTGGMGAYSPARLMNEDLEREILSTIIEPTLKGLQQEGISFVGVLFAGLMVHNNKPTLLEYNVRFGDPECQTLMLRLESDLLAVLYACATENLASLPPMQWSSDPSMCVVMCAKGYPDTPIKNSPIKNLEVFSANKKGALLFHAGTQKTKDGILSMGGRVLNICAKAPTLKEAQKNIYDSIILIDWPDGFYRHDIGWRAL